MCEICLDLLDTVSSSLFLKDGTSRLIKIHSSTYVSKKNILRLKGRCVSTNFLGLVPPFMPTRAFSLSIYQQRFTFLAINKELRHKRNLRLQDKNDGYQSYKNDYSYIEPGKKAQVKTEKSKDYRIEITRRTYFSLEKHASLFKKI